MTTGPRGEISGRQMNSPGLSAAIAARSTASAFPPHATSGVEIMPSRNSRRSIGILLLSERRRVLRDVISRKFVVSRNIVNKAGNTARRAGVSPAALIIIVSAAAMHTPLPRMGHPRHRRSSKRGAALPRRIAQPPKATFVTRLQPSQSPGRPARQLPDQSTTLWVESSSTDSSRLRGAQP